MKVSQTNDGNDFRLPLFLKDRGGQLKVGSIFCSECGDLVEELVTLEELEQKGIKYYGCTCGLHTGELKDGNATPMTPYERVMEALGREYEEVRIKYIDGDGCEIGYKAHAYDIKGDVLHIIPYGEEDKKAICITLRDKMTIVWEDRLDQLPCKWYTFEQCDTIKALFGQVQEVLTTTDGQPFGLDMYQSTAHFIDDCL